MNESGGTPNDYCANLPSCPQLCAAAPEALEARFQPQGRECHQGLAKESTVSSAQGFGHSTGVCHRPSDRRRETESRLPYPQGK